MSQKLHGRKGRLYVAATSGGSASLVPGINQFTIDANTDQADVTAFGDSFHDYVTGLPDAKGTYSGVYVEGATQMFAAALDGLKRAMYWYPNVDDMSKYVTGYAFFDQSYDAAIGDGQKISGNWVSSGGLTPVGFGS